MSLIKAKEINIYRKTITGLFQEKKIANVGIHLLSALKDKQVRYFIAKSIINGTFMITLRDFIIIWLIENKFNKKNINPR